MTVKGLIERLQQMPPDATVVCSEPNGHDEYDVKFAAFEVSRHYNDVDADKDDCVVYVGPRYTHPN